MFKPGESGNPKGSRKAKLFEDALKRAIVQEDGQRVREAAEKLLTLAAAGESWALKELADRLDGKVAQSLIHSGDDERPPLQVLTRTIIAPPE
jgi:hypothetical protein